MKISNLIKIVMLSSSFLLGFPSAVIAGNQTGFYFGAAVGDTKIKAPSFSENGTSGKLFLGYNMGIIPLIDIGVEASYINFGKATANNDLIANSYDISGADVFGVVGFNLGAIGLFAKVGGINWSSDIIRDSVSTSRSGSDAAYGIGAKVQFDSIGVRLEYEIFDVSAVDDLTMLSLAIFATY
jgi:hypothetical protein